jgi:hypothetical protein
LPFFWSRNSKTIAAARSKNATEKVAAVEVFSPTAVKPQKMLRQAMKIKIIPLLYRGRPQGLRASLARAEAPWR